MKSNSFVLYFEEGSFSNSPHCIISLSLYLSSNKMHTWKTEFLHTAVYSVQCTAEPSATENMRGQAGSIQLHTYWPLLPGKLWSVFCAVSHTTRQMYWRISMETIYACFYRGSCMAKKSKGGEKGSRMELEAIAHSKCLIQQHCWIDFFLEKI